MDLINLMSCYDKGMKECITDDLLVEILLRLPFKSLCRFKCVSKSRYRLISSDYLQQRLPSIATGLLFRPKWTKSNPHPKVRYGCTSTNETIQECNLEFFPFGETSKVIDASNGMLLYYSKAPTTFFYVVNKVIKSWVSLPRPQKATKYESFLAFDPYKSADFKVVCFTAFPAQGAEFEIYSSNTGKWDQHEVHFGVQMYAAEHYSDGLLYIRAALYIYGCCYGFGKFLMQFDSAAQMDNSSIAKAAYTMDISI